MRAPLLALCLAAPLTALAQSVPETPGRMEAAWRAAFDIQGDMLTPAQHVELAALAWHIVAGDLCEDIAVDQEKFAAALGAMKHGDGDDTTEEERRFFRDFVLINLGVAVGIMLAEHADDVPATCEEAHETMKEEGAEHLFVASE